MECTPGIPRETEYGCVSQFRRKAVEEYAGECLTYQNYEQEYVHNEISGDSFHSTFTSYTNYPENAQLTPEYILS